MNKLLNLIAIMAICTVAPVLGYQTVTIINGSETSDLMVTFNSKSSGDIISARLFVNVVNVSHTRGPKPQYAARGSSKQEVILPLEPLKVTVTATDISGEIWEQVSFELNLEELSRTQTIVFGDAQAKFIYPDGTDKYKEYDPCK